MPVEEEGIGVLSLDRPDQTVPSGTPADADPASDQALDWFVRLQGAADAGDLEAFDRWRDARIENERAYAELLRIWDMPEVAAASRNVARLQGVEGASRISGPITTMPRRPRVWRPAFAAMAASIALIVGVLEYPALLIRWQADYLTAAGEQQNVTLPDGSTMLLNTASAVTLDFTDGRRNVRVLEGEAWFDVTHDPAHPFKVAGRYGEAEVKGTSFTVRAGDDGDLVLLERGRVDVALLPDRHGGVELQPGEMIEVREDTLSSVRKADPVRDLAWREGRVIFHSRPFGAAIQELARYYDGSVLSVSDRSANILVSGNYRLDDAESAIRSLAEVVGAKMTRLPGGLIILR